MATSERSFEMALRFNVTSAFLLSKLVVPHMVEAGAGAIVNISSRSASMVQPCFTAYATAKAALSMMTRAMAPELAPKIRVNAIEVGGIETDALAHVLSDASVRAQLEGNTPMQRVGLPADIAAAVVYLSSPASSFVTGKIFEVDGGVEVPRVHDPVRTPLGSPAGATLVGGRRRTPISPASIATDGGSPTLDDRSSLRQERDHDDVELIQLVPRRIAACGRCTSASRPYRPTSADRPLQRAGSPNRTRRRCCESCRGNRNRSTRACQPPNSK